MISEGRDEFPLFFSHKEQKFASILLGKTEEPNFLFNKEYRFISRDDFKNYDFFLD